MGKFKSRKCLISFSRDYARKGQKNKKALKNQGFSRLYLFYSFFVAGVGFVGPVKNIVVSGTRQGSYPILLVFSLVALASPSTGRACAPSPLPPPSVVEGYSSISTRNEKRHPTGCLFVSGMRAQKRYQAPLCSFKSTRF